MNKRKILRVLLLALLLIGVVVSNGCRSKPAPSEPPHPPEVPKPSAPEQPKPPEVPKLPAPEQPKKVRPELVLKVNGKEIARLPQGDCEDHSWEFANVKVNSGDRVEVVAVDNDGNEIWKDDVGTIPNYVDYLKEELSNLSAEGKTIVERLEKKNVPVSFEKLGRNIRGSYNPDTNDIKLSEDYLKGPWAIVLSTLAHEGTHAGQDWSQVDFPTAEGRKRLEAKKQQVYRAQQDLANKKITQAEYDKIVADYRAYAESQYNKAVDYEVEAFQAGLRAWKATGGAEQSSNYSNLVNGKIRECKRFSSMSESQLRAEIASRYTNYKAPYVIPGVYDG